MAIPQADLDAVNAMQKKTLAAFKHHDIEAFVSTFTEDCTFMTPGSAVIKGRAAMKSVAEGFYKSGATEGKIIKEEAMPMGECIFKILEVQLINKDNNVLDTVNAVQIWRKDNGEWLHLFEIVNSQTPSKPPSS
ncbi:uncharacterized protein [Dysidea avara]|uniref:uncharacterized protein isoform X2 n=1 Tax=Dysidea avara TaxID=196820 RepID=UPI00331B6B0F